jgi:hypothetical protein
MRLAEGDPMPMFARNRRSRWPAAAALLCCVACSGGASSDPPPPDPAGTFTANLLPGSWVDLESGVTGGAVADLQLDGAGNLVAVDELVPVGTAAYLAAVADVELPTAGWRRSTAGTPQAAVVVKSDQSVAYVVLVTAALAGGGLELRWIPVAHQYKVVVSTAGAGWGSVVSDPPGISCPAGASGWACAEPYRPGTIVTLTETPADLDLCTEPGYTQFDRRSYFDRWELQGGGAVPGCGTGAACQVTDGSTFPIVARFERTADILIPDPARDAARGGSVTHDIAVPALECGVAPGGSTEAWCRYRLPFGTSVTLTLVPEPGYVVGGFLPTGTQGSPSGACSGGIYSTYDCGGLGNGTSTCTFLAGQRLQQVAGGFGSGWGGQESVQVMFLAQ